MRCLREEWTKDDAGRAVTARLLGVTVQAPSQSAGMAFAAMVEKFLPEHEPVATARELEGVSQVCDTPTARQGNGAVAKW